MVYEIQEQKAKPNSDMAHSYTTHISLCQERRWTGQGTHRRFGTNNYALTSSRFGLLLQIDLRHPAGFSSAFTAFQGNLGKGDIVHYGFFIERRCRS